MTRLHDAGFGFAVGDFLRAAEEGRLDAVDQYLQAGMSPDAASAEGETALRRAASAGRVDVIRRLIEAGAEVEHETPDGETGLMAAAESGSHESVRLLLMAGARPAAKTADGWSALTLAAMGGHREVVEAIAPLAPGQLDDALHLASVTGDSAVLDVLLRNGASVYARSLENRTALMYAAMNGHMEIAKLLLRHGANRFSLDDDDRTAAELARDAGYYELASYLAEPVVPEEAEAEAMATTRSGIDGWWLDASPRAEGEVTDPSEFRPAALASLDGAVVRWDGAAGEEDSGSTNDDALIDEREAAPPAGVAADRSSGPDPAASRESGATPAGSMISPEARLIRYRESLLPIVVDEVDAGGGRASVRDLRAGSDAPAVAVGPGDLLPGTELEVIELQNRRIHSKLSQGELVDVSRVLVRDRDTGERLLLVRGVRARESQGVALFSPGDGRLYEARAGDEFTVQGAAGERFRVLEVRPTQLLLEHAGSGSVVTIDRGGVVAPED